MELPETFCLIDTEYTAWEGSQETKWSKDGEEKELIQLSALLLRKCKNHIFIVDELNLFVKPKINPKLSNYITKLTGITNKKLFENGISFDEAMNKFYKFTPFFVFVGNKFALSKSVSEFFLIISANIAVYFSPIDA